MALGDNIPGWASMSPDQRAHALMFVMAGGTYPTPPAGVPAGATPEFYTMGNGADNGNATPQLAGYSQYTSGDKYSQYDPSGQYVGEMAMHSSMPMAQYGALIPALASGGALAMYGLTGGLGAGAAGGAGGFIGEGVASGIPAWDAAAGLTPGQLAAGSGALAAGSSGASQAAVDAAAQSAAQGGAGGFVGEGAASGIPAWDTAAGLTPELGATGGTAALGAGGGGVVPPNPYYTGNPIVDGLKTAAYQAGAGTGSGGFNWGSLLGPALNAVGGGVAANAAGKAADAQVAAVNSSNQTLKDIFDKQVALQEPFRQGGIAGLNALQTQLGVGGDPNALGYGSAAKSFGMSDFQTDPGYQFRLDQGQKALERQLSAGGSLYSGKALKDMTNYVQGQASQEYGNAFNRFQVERQAKLNPLQSLAGVGQSSANTLTGAAGNYGTNVANNQQSAGNAQAAGIVGQTNALNNAISQGWSMYQQNNMLNKLFPTGA